MIGFVALATEPKGVCYPPSINAANNLQTICIDKVSLPTLGMDLRPDDAEK